MSGHVFPRCQECAGLEVVLKATTERLERLQPYADALREALREMWAAHQRVDPHDEERCSNCILARAALLSGGGS